MVDTSTTTMTASKYGNGDDRLASMDHQIAALDQELRKLQVALNDKHVRYRVRQQLRQKAMQALQRKRQWEQLRDRTVAQSFQQEQLQFQLESAQATAATVQSLQQARSCLRQTLSPVSEADGIEMDLYEMMEDMDHVNHSLCYSTPDDLDEADLEAEFLMLEEDMFDDDDLPSVAGGGGVPVASRGLPVRSRQQDDYDGAVTVATTRSTTTERSMRSRKSSTPTTNGIRISPSSLSASSLSPLDLPLPPTETRGEQNLSSAGRNHPTTETQSVRDDALSTISELGPSPAADDVPSAAGGSSAENLTPPHSASFRDIGSTASSAGGQCASADSMPESMPRSNGPAVGSNASIAGRRINGSRNTGEKPAVTSSAASVSTSSSRTNVVRSASNFSKASGSHAPLATPRSAKTCNSNHSLGLTSRANVLSIAHTAPTTTTNSEEPPPQAQTSAFIAPPSFASAPSSASAQTPAAAATSSLNIHQYFDEARNAEHIVAPSERKLHPSTSTNSALTQRAGNVSPTKTRLDGANSHEDDDEECWSSSPFEQFMSMFRLSRNNKDHFLSTSKRRAKTGMERDDIYNLNLVQ